MLSRFAAILAITAVLPAASHAAERHPGSPLRALADSNGTHRWELRWDSVSLYHATTSQLIQRFPLEGAAQSSSRDSCPPDIVVGAGGVVYVTSNVQPVLWRVHPAVGTVERLDLEVDSDRTKDFGFTSLDLSANGSTLYGVSSADGATWRLEPAARMAFKIGPATGTDRNCGP